MRAKRQGHSFFSPLFTMLGRRGRERVSGWKQKKRCINYASSLSKDIFPSVKGVGFKIRSQVLVILIGVFKPFHRRIGRVRSHVLPFAFRRLWTH